MRSLTGAFDGCLNLEKITLPLNTSEHFGYLFDAGDGPTSLKEVNIIGSTTIPKNAFYECRNITNITIGDSVKSIGDRAFCFCSSLTSITMENSVKNIGECAFTYLGKCTIAYNGTKKEWKAITKEKGWDTGSKIKVKFLKKK